MCFFKKQDSDLGSGFKILICRIRIRSRIRPKMDWRALPTCPGSCTIPARIALVTFQASSKCPVVCRYLPGWLYLPC